ncbi:MAG: prephenate dehydrogenase/arogenate dehydrogenase family protein, partial [Candidatus Eremiobacteraeota bacterium]|nr:prephenate dehydrogenase/arogenate dehydrogenase family protein [Candidatus Eremiobacteraeota bacterium]
GASFATQSLAALVARSRAVVRAAPLAATLEQIAELERDLPAHVESIFDVASVKAPVARAAAGLARFVGTHPIAGSERSGPQAARADLFAGRVWTYDACASEPARTRAVAFVEAMGARPVAIASDEHDRIVALTSHLPQIVSVALGAQLAPRRDDDAAVRALCGTGMRSMLRLAGSSWTVWEAVLLANAGPLAQEVRRLADILSGTAAALETGASGELADRFARAAAAHGRLHANDSAPSDVFSSDER